ncbi:hypothetical protein FQN55_003346 [Onygenales sp. PD_40]|nr:hypothetical protein FQN55_003346 [Onygenales sp. PD_40]
MKYLSLFTLFTLSSLALSAPSTLATRETEKKATDRLLFKASMKEFQAARKAKNPSSLDWSSDGCSKSPDHPGFNFLPSCQRHDFGYRNYKDQKRFSKKNKNKIDKNFRDDLYNSCKKEDSKHDAKSCKEIADIYYWAVSHFATKKREMLEGMDGGLEKRDEGDIFDDEDDEGDILGDEDDELEKRDEGDILDDEDEIEGSDDELEKRDEGEILDDGDDGDDELEKRNEGEILDADDDDDDDESDGEDDE